MSRRSALAGAGLAAALVGCGYHFANRSAETFVPELGEVTTPHAEVAAALLDGTRAELGRHGALGDGPTDPRSRSVGSGGAVLRVDLLRVDERAEGIVSAGAAPVARGLRITVVGRARLAEPSARDTGDVEASEVIAAGPGVGSVAGEQVGADAAASAAARRLGARLARKILGYPEP